MVEQFAQVPIDLFHITRLEGEQAQVSARAFDHAQFTIGDEFLLCYTVAHGGDHVLVYGHDEGPSLDAAQSRSQVAVGVAAHIPCCHFHAVHKRSLGSIGSK